MIANNPYWKIVLVADFSLTGRLCPLEERFRERAIRWIDQRHEQGKDRIDPGHFERAKSNIRTVANELFQILNLTDIAFIETNKLSDPASAKRWGAFLTKTRENKEETSKATCCSVATLTIYACNHSCGRNGNAPWSIYKKSSEVHAFFPGKTLIERQIEVCVHRGWKILSLLEDTEPMLSPLQIILCI